MAKGKATQAAAGKTSSTTTAPRALNAVATAQAIANLLKDATVKESATRVSVRLKGQSRQVFGIVPGKGTAIEVSCPMFTRKHNPSMKSRRNYSIINLRNPSQADVVALAKSAFKTANLL